MEVKKELLAPCGLYCGVCAIYIAHRDNNLKFKEVLAKGVYGPLITKVEDVQCEGCLSPGIVSKTCKVCAIRPCVQKKGILGCHECSDFPCKKINGLPHPIAKKVILRAIPIRKELGTEKWVEEEEKRYHCPNCRNKLFRGVKRCNKCKVEVDVD